MDKFTYRVYFSDGNQKLFEAHCKEDVEIYLVLNGYNSSDFNIEIA